MHYSKRYSHYMPFFLFFRRSGNAFALFLMPFEGIVGFYLFFVVAFFFSNAVAWMVLNPFLRDANTCSPS